MGIFINIRHYHPLNSGVRLKNVILSHLKEIISIFVIKDLNQNLSIVYDEEASKN